MRAGNDEQRALTRECLFKALVRLMDEKPLAHISVTELTERAGVSRTAFYRNYESKQQVLDDYFSQLFDRYINELRRHTDLEIYDFSLGFFAYFEPHARLVEQMLENGLSGMLLEIFERDLAEIISRGLHRVDPALLESPYVRHFMAGGLFNVMVEWVNSGRRETVEEMAAEIASYLGRLFPGSGRDCAAQVVAG